MVLTERRDEGRALFGGDQLVERIQENQLFLFADDRSSLDRYIASDIDPWDSKSSGPSSVDESGAVVAGDVQCSCVVFWVYSHVLNQPSNLGSFTWFKLGDGLCPFYGRRNFPDLLSLQMFERFGQSLENPRQALSAPSSV